ncbi:hypothetical protein CKA32_001097 [Geitlerinema sp. FC II]|nr:hypothetical protein CKA32_001097 [Geitlerinema sp. FC II]
MIIIFNFLNSRFKQMNFKSNNAIFWVFFAFFNEVMTDAVRPKLH